MHKRDPERYVGMALWLILIVFLIAPGLTFAGVGGSDVPTVTSPVSIGQTGLSWSFTVKNESTTPNDVDLIQIQTTNNIFFTTTCGTPSPDGVCPVASQEAANTITISPLTATGATGTACAGISFTVAATGSPNEYVFTPGANVILGPSTPGGNAATCKVNFTVNVNAAPVHDSSGSPGLQTSQLARVTVLEDTSTNETGSAAGTSTVTVNIAAPDIATLPNPSGGVIGAVLKDSATLSGGANPTGTITFKLFDVSDQTCSGSPIFTNTVTVSGNGAYNSSAGFTTVAAGTYHWTATYSGDANNQGKTSICSDESVVITTQLKLVTVPQPSSGALGSVLNDSAVLTGGVNPTGTITFKLFGPSDPTCGAAAIFTNTVPVSGAGTYNTSAGFTVVAPGTYHWIATYSGDANNICQSPNICSDQCGDEPVNIAAPISIVTMPNPSSGNIGVVLKDSAILTGGVNPTGTITFRLFGPNDQTCAAAPIFTETVTVNGDGTYSTSGGFTTVEAGRYHWTATYSGDANNQCVSPNVCADTCDAEPVVVGTPHHGGAEDPYIAVVGNDIDANLFYLSDKYAQFLNDQSFGSIPITGEGFTTSTSVIQPEVCDTTGFAAGPQNGPPFTFRGNFNGRVTAGNAGWYEWNIRLPKKPSGEINLCIQCGILKPNAFTFLGFESVLDCAAETGERIGNGFCVRQEALPGTNPIITGALPKIFARVLPGPYAPIAFTPFNLTAFRNPGTYSPFSGTVLVNGVAGQILDGTDDASRILLKSCMDKCIVVKLPVTGQINALSQVEYDLEAGDLINVRMNIPRPNTVDIYCHQESLKIMGIGEGTF